MGRSLIVPYKRSCEAFLFDSRRGFWKIGSGGRKTKSRAATRLP